LIVGLTTPFDTPQTNVFAEQKEVATNLFQAAKSVESQVSMAVKTKNVSWLGKLKVLAKEICDLLVEFVVNAIRFAIVKFIIEMCAQIMSAVVAAITKKGGKIDISSPGVHCAGSSTPIPQVPQDPRAVGSPFRSEASRYWA
jgi:hypothetical protein